MATACNAIIAPTKILIDLGRESTALMIASIVDIVRIPLARACMVACFTRAQGGDDRME